MWKLNACVHSALIHQRVPQIRTKFIFTFTCKCNSNLSPFAFEEKQLRNCFAIFRWWSNTKQAFNGCHFLTKKPRTCKQTNKLIGKKRFTVIRLKCFQQSVHVLYDQKKFQYYFFPGKKWHYKYAVCKWFFSLQIFTKS